MKRPHAVAFAACMLLAVTVAAVAQRPAAPPTIGFLGMDSRMQGLRVDAFRDELRRLGYVEGKTIIIETRFAEGDFKRLPELARELVAQDVKVIVTAAPPAVRAAQAATTTIPIVMLVHDPVGMGFAETLARPGRNITGVAFQDTELSTKRLDLLRQAIPNLTRVAVLWNRAGGGEAGVKVVTDAAKALGMELLPLQVDGPGEFARAIADAKRWSAQAVLQMAAPMFTLNRKALVDLLNANRLPASCELREYVADGCLMTYSADLNRLFGDMARFVDRILKGAKPSDLAIEQPRDFDFVINLTTAKALGVMIPASLRLQATDVIQ